MGNLAAVCRSADGELTCNRTHETAKFRSTDIHETILQKMSVFGTFEPWIL
jgi:hypothetical protein